jgi:hypothetical protein
MRRIGNEQGAITIEPLLAQVGLVAEVVPDIAAGEQESGGVRRQIGVFTLHPGARHVPGVGEGIGLAPRGSLRGVGVATAAAEQHGDGMALEGGAAAVACHWMSFGHSRQEAICIKP